MSYDNRNTTFEFSMSNYPRNYLVPINFMWLSWYYSVVNQVTGGGRSLAPAPGAGSGSDSGT